MKRWKKGLAYAGAAAAILTAGYFVRAGVNACRHHGRQNQAITAPQPMSEKLVRTPQPEIKMAKRPKAASEIDWKKTHLIILNGRPHPINDESTLAAAMAGLENDAKGIYIAGLDGRLNKRIKMFGDGSRISLSDVRALLSAVASDHSEGDTLFVYITGNSERVRFENIDAHGIDHTILPKMLSDNFGGHIVLVLDQNPCHHFMKALVGDVKFDRVTWMAPALRGEAQGRHFGKAFWDSLKKGADPDKDGRSTLRESFALGMRELPGRDGTFRQYHKGNMMIKSLKGIRDGVVMVTADWCGACKLMTPVFLSVNIGCYGTLPFYGMDVKDFQDEVGGKVTLPHLLIKRDGKVVASSSGAMTMKQFYEWLVKNGAMGIRITMEYLKQQGKISDNDI